MGGERATRSWQSCCPAPDGSRSVPGAVPGAVPIDETEFARWQGEAARALEAARVQSAAGLHNWACFAAEQAGQLSLKGLLHGVGAAPWGHDLVELGSKAAEALGPAWRRELEAPLQTLSQYYIPTRYPDANPSGTPGGHYGTHDARTAVSLAENLLVSVSDIWNALIEADGS